MIIAEKIMSLRKQYGWSQEELAGLVGVSRQWRYLFYRQYQT